MEYAGDERTRETEQNQDLADPGATIVRVEATRARAEVRKCSQKIAVTDCAFG